MSGQSHVGNRGLYQADDQRHSPLSEAREAQRNREHPPQSSRRGSQHHREQEELKRAHGVPSDEELAKVNPMAPAKMHGHKPSRGAQVDAELMKEDEERLRQKGIK